MRLFAHIILYKFSSLRACPHKHILVYEIAQLMPGAEARNMKFLYYTLLSCNAILPTPVLTQKLFTALASAFNRLPVRALRGHFRGWSVEGLYCILLGEGDGVPKVHYSL